MYKRILFLMLLALPLLQGCIAVVAGGAAVGVVHDRRGGDVVIGDRRTQLGITNAINLDKSIIHGNFRVKVVVYNGTVLLCGQVESAAAKRRAGEIADGIEGAQRIDNELEITDEPNGFWRRRADNALSARVKTALLDITSLPGFDASRVDVTSANHVVYLMGLVSHEEADAATEIARNVGGVDKVVKLFEYREPDA